MILGQLSNHYETLSLPQADPSIDYNDPINKIPTPIDERGLVDTDAVIAIAKSTVDPEYKWQKDPDIHHFYWYEGWYPDNFVPSNPHVFRNLAIHKGLMPRDCHEWIEKITIPPAVPTASVMQYRIEAWSIAKNLFKSARMTINRERQAINRPLTLELHSDVLTKSQGSNIDKVWLHKEFERHFNGVLINLGRNANLPPEHRLIDQEKDIDEIATALGRVVRKKAIDCRPLLRAA
jgi:hypothetical protein